MKWLALLGIILLVLIAGCKPPLSALPLLEGEYVCNPPYIIDGKGCCLDTNNNSICDRDEDIPKTYYEEEPIERHIWTGGGEMEKTELGGLIDGVITNFAVFDKDGNCAWIDGHVKFILKDSKGNAVYTKEMDLTTKDIAKGFDCLVGPLEFPISNISQLDSIATIYVEYTTSKGQLLTESGEVEEPFDYTVGGKY